MTAVRPEQPMDKACYFPFSQAAAGQETCMPQRKGRIQRYLGADPSLSALYEKLETHAFPLLSSNYDITRECNLRCEGCLFFEGPDFLDHPDDKSLADYQAFFKGEMDRGVNFAYFAGGEPSLEQERLRVAQRYLPRGIIATNGTIRIASDIRYAIHVSLWGGPDSTRKMRGGSVFQRALRNYRHDDRAVFIYTVNHQNIDSIPQVAAICHEYGVRLSFSHFSSTEQYEHKLRDGTPNDSRFFRFSCESDNLRLTDDDRLRVHDILEQMIDTYPRTVIYSRHYNDWISQGGSLYRLDPETGLALDCPIRLSKFHRHYHVDLTQSDGKCCSPNIACSDCRAYAMALATFRHRIRHYLDSMESFAHWIEVMDMWCQLYLLGWDDIETPGTEKLSGVHQKCTAS